MARVQLLPREVSELIAAGEVIERPASIVKELVENSIDAGASSVVVEIQNGGTKYIRVTDDGCGMEPDDAVTAFLRHATSKVRTADDLSAIGTLGFRGEALASIAAVAHVEMMTKTAENDLGAFVKYSGSELKEHTEAGCPKGTTIVIRDIFYNVPARLKFLKSDVSEGNAVASIVEKIAVSHPEIAFRFIRDNKPVFSTPGDGKLISAIYTVFGREFAAAMLPVEYELSGIKVTGFISKPAFSRSNRSMQHFFVNDRYAQSRTCAVALEQAYKGSLMTGKFPACVLNISLPFAMVDVNVHPAKIEVRFVSEKTVFDALYFAVKSALAAADPLKNLQKKDLTVTSPFTEPAEAPEQPSLTVKTVPVAPAPAPAPKAEPPKAVEEKKPEKSAPVSYPDPDKVMEEAKKNTFLNYRELMPKRSRVNIDAEVEVEDFYGEVSVADVGSGYTVGKKQDEPVKQDEPIIEETPAPKAPVMEEAPLPAVEETPTETPILQNHSYRYIGEVFFTYILAEADGELLLIDKHAAHEKILYNKLKAQNQSLDKQMLLIGLPVSLSREEHEAVLENEELLGKMGFSAEDFGQHTVMLRAVPAVSQNVDPEEMFLDVAAGLLDRSKQSIPQKADEILHRIACRSAVKANDKNSPQELLELIRAVWEDDEVRYCPHGRPVLLTFTKKEIEKMFGRLG